VFTWPVQVVAAQANYVRVRLDGLAPAAASETAGARQKIAPDPAQGQLVGGSGAPATAPALELLCTVRALLKKMKQTVLVGDRVRVNSIDWLSARGALPSAECQRRVAMTTFIVCATVWANVGGNVWGIHDFTHDRVLT
jgi:hypothetical protein